MVVNQRREERWNGDRVVRRVLNPRVARRVVSAEGQDPPSRAHGVELFVLSTGPAGRCPNAHIGGPPAAASLQALASKERPHSSGRL